MIRTQEATGKTVDEARTACLLGKPLRKELCVHSGYGKL